jgi:tetratricopeptide (TPR) repeat protein
LAREARFDEAIQAWQQVERLAPQDGEAPRMIAMLTLEWSRVSEDVQEEEIPSEEDARGETPSSPAEARGESRKPRTLVLSQRQQLEQAIVNNPEDESNYLTLAELYLQERRTFDAQRILTKALSVSKDLRIVERLEDVNILRAQEQVQIARRRAVEERTQEARDLAENLCREMQRLELDVFRARVDRYPDNNTLKYQLGMRLKQLGRFREAIEPLQGGLEVPEHRAAASLEIGEILQRYKQFPRALQCYRQAVQLAAGESALAGCRTRALYRAGVLAESMALVDSARHYFSELVQTAPHYKDAQSRLDKLREIDEDS